MVTCESFVTLDLSVISRFFQLNTGQLNDSDVGRDLNVERAWLQGITGCGIVVAVVDDGKKEALLHFLVCRVCA